MSAPVEPLPDTRLEAARLFGEVFGGGGGAAALVRDLVREVDRLRAANADLQAQLANAARSIGGGAL